MSGSSRSPELVADAPVTACRNSGRNTMAPNMAQPRMNDSTTPTVNTPSRKRRMGRIGSAARCSQTTKPASSAAEIAKSPTIVSEPHGYSLPPHTSARSSAETPAMRSAAPR